MCSVQYTELLPGLYGNTTHPERGTYNQNIAGHTIKKPTGYENKTKQEKKPADKEANGSSRSQLEGQ